MSSPFFDPSSTSSAWLNALRGIDPAAWDKLAVVYAPLVFRLAERHGLQDSDAADVTQEVFRKTLRSIDRYESNRPAYRFRKWFATIALNAIRDFKRSRRNGPAILDGSAARDAINHFPSASDPESGGAADALQTAAAVPDSDVDETGDCDPDEIGFSDRDVLKSALEAIREQVAPQQWQIFERRMLSGRSVAEIADEFAVSEANVYKICQRILGRFRKEYGDLIADEDNP